MTLVALVGVVLWASRRGFDIADESYYLNGYAHPQRGPVATQYDALVAWISGPFDPGIVGFRVARLVVLLGSSAFLGVALHRFGLRRLRPSLAAAMPTLPVTLLTVTIAGLLGYAWLPQTMSYNDLTAAALYVQTGCLLLAASTLDDARPLQRSAVVALVVLGAFSVLLVFIKYPSELVAGVGVAAFVALLPRSVRLRAVLWIALGAAVTVVVLANGTLGGPISLRALANSRADEAHTPWVLLKMYTTFTVDDLPRAATSGALRIVAIVGLLWAAPVLARRRRALAIGLATVCAGFVIFEIADLARRGEGGYAFGKGYFAFLHHADLIVSLLIAAAIASLLGWLTRRGTDRDGAPQPERDRAFAAACALAFWVPVAGSVGTGNPPLEQTTVYAAGFGCLLVLAAAWTTEATGTIRSVPNPGLALAVVGIALGAQAAVGLVRHPYDLPRNLRHQSVALAESPPLDGVRIDPPTARMLREFAEILRVRTTVTSGELMIAPWSGLQYASGLPSPFNGWPEKGRTHACDIVLGSSRRIRRTVVVLESAKRTKEQIDCLRALRQAYETEFVEVGRFEVPALPGIRLAEPVVVRVRQDRVRP